MKYLLIIFLCVTIFYTAQINAKVIHVKDGDTVVVLLEDNIQKTLRLAEVDCPESGQPFGKNAKEFTSTQIFGKQITFIATDEDRYGRTIAKIYYENKYLSEEIIRAGFGWWYYQYSKDKNLGILQKQAEDKKIGLWQDKNAVSPWDYRKQQRAVSQF
ncbi:thermonuclease family protein [Kaistella sp. G5-32]|uniref:Thermonuclease family protein n=1 Tax=Kaistella gelatinilytica TaxID=2787636 RepID=A0ABS0FBU7_9FLAO|nr:thermonuclease family protein [Kaistella gelatinilytica]MBF8457147.1 thermonuclease family protein [Kaistella gelatinilytica]